MKIKVRWKPTVDAFAESPMGLCYVAAIRPMALVEGGLATIYPVQYRGKKFTVCGAWQLSKPAPRKGARR